MAEKINMTPKQSGDQLTAAEFNTIVGKIDAAIEEVNGHASSLAEAQQALGGLADDLDSESQARQQADSGKVDKQEGLGLSENSFTTPEKTKLAAIDHQVSQVVTWETGEAKPVILADKLAGELVEGKTHVVTIITFNDESTAATIKVVGDNVVDFAADLDGAVIAIAENTDGSIIIGGNFTGMLKKLAADGTEVAEFAANMPELNGEVIAVAVNTDGSIIIGGNFTGMLKKLAADGTEVAAFAANIPVLDSVIHSIAINGDGTILIGLHYTETYNMLIKLAADGTEVAAFTANLPAFDDDIYSIAINADGTIITGGMFTGYLKKFNADGTKVNTFSENLPALDSYVNAIAINADGTIIIAGDFTGKLKKLNADGTEDATFSAAIPALDGNVKCIAIDEDGNIYFGGSFSGCLGKILATGVADEVFQPIAEINDLVNDIIVSDGIYVGGGTENYIDKLNILTGQKYEYNDYQLNKKVDKEPGKGLSTNDYTDEDRAKVRALYPQASVIVQTTSDPLQNGINLLEAYVQAKLLQPGGEPLSETNRAVLLILPGNYQLGETPLILDTSFIDVVGLSSERTHQRIMANTDSIYGNCVIRQTAGDIKIKNLTLELVCSNSLAETLNNNDADSAVYFPDNNLGNTYLDNIELIVVDEGTAHATRRGVGYSGEYRNIKIEGGSAFCSGAYDLSGNFVNIISFWSIFNTTSGSIVGFFSNIFADLVEKTGFTTDNGNIYGAFENMELRADAGAIKTNSGEFEAYCKNVKCDSGFVAEEINGKFYNCIGAFIGKLSGNFYNCECRDQYGFGGQTGSISGLLYYCINRCDEVFKVPVDEGKIYASVDSAGFHAVIEPES